MEINSVKVIYLIDITHCYTNVNKHNIANRYLL